MKLNNAIASRVNKTVYRDGNHAIKVFDKTFSKSDILNEALNHARVEETGLKVPHLYSVTTLDDGRWAIVMDYIEGKTLAQLMSENPEKTDEYIDRFVNLQLNMHKKNAPLLGKLRDKMNRKINAADINDTCRYELLTRLDSMPKHNKLCHGDFNPSNIICAEDGDYIIDWSHATQGNASADVARSYLLFCLSDKRPIAEQYIRLFCEKSGTELKYVQNWMPIVAASQSVKGNVNEYELLKKWCDVCQYE